MSDMRIVDALQRLRSGRVTFIRSPSRWRRRHVGRKDGGSEVPRDLCEDWVSGSALDIFLTSALADLKR